MQSHVMSSIWTDVRWDQGATDELVRQLLATAGALGDVVGILRGGAGPVAPGDWGGPHRDAFDVDRLRIAGTAERLAEQLLHTAASAGATAAAADGEQRLRVRLRHRAMAADGCVPERPC